jgi:hypothetical protein
VARRLFSFREGEIALESSLHGGENLPRVPQGDLTPDSIAVHAASRWLLGAER